MSDETRRKRMRLRAWRRGTREMDLALGRYADRYLAELEGADLDLFEQVLEQDDHALYRWISGQDPEPKRFSGVISAIRQSLAEHHPA